MLRVTLLVTALAISNCLGQDQPVPRELHGVVQELFIRPELRNAIELSQQQFDGIKKLAENKELNELRMKLTLAHLSFDEAPNDKSTKRLRAAEDAFQAPYRKELEKVLQTEQINALIPASMRLEFSTGLAPFDSHKVRQFCGISKELFAEIEPQIRKTTSALPQQVNEVVFKHAHAVLSSLPSESKKLFVQYAGNKYLPETEVDPNAAVSDIPYSPRVPTVTSIMMAVDDLQLARALRMTPTQVAKLNTLYDENRAELSKAFNSPNPEIENQFLNLQRSAFMKMRDVLSDEQFSRIAKNRACVEFSANFAQPFERQELVKFLKLSPESLRHIVQIAVVERHKLEKAYDSINFTVFDEIASLLPKVEQAKIRSLFDGVWIK